MSETVEEVVPVEAPVETPVETPVVVELPEQRFEWQPTDAEGRPIGSKQVIKFRTEDEKFQKLVEQNNLVIRKMREMNRKTYTGESVEDTVPESAQKIENRKSFASRKLTADEKIQLAKDMQD